MSDEQDSSAKWKKGCLIALALLFIFGCCGFVLGSFACNSAYTRGQDVMSQQVVTTLTRACEGNPRQAEYLAELAYFEQSRSEIGVLTFSLITNRYSEIAADGIIDAVELDHMMELLADVHAHHGNVNLQDYPLAR